MKKCLAIAALLLASTAAQAQYTIEYGGRTIRIDPDRGTVSIPGVYDNTGRPSKRSKTEDNDRSSKQPPQQAKDRSEDRSANRSGCGSCACSGRTGGGACHPGASSRPCSNGPTVGHDRGCGARRYSDRSACSTGFAGYRAASGKTCAGSHRRRGASGTRRHLPLSPFRPPIRRLAFG